MADNIIPSEILFFLGAGASVKADVPATFKFVNEFVDYLAATDKDVIEIVRNLENFFNIYDQFNSVSFLDYRGFRKQWEQIAEVKSFLEKIAPIFLKPLNDPGNIDVNPG